MHTEIILDTVFKCKHCVTIETRVAVLRITLLTYFFHLEIQVLSISLVSFCNSISQIFFN